MTRSWRELPTGRVVRLDGDPDAVALAVEPLPDDAPALVAYVPRSARTPADVVADVLGELDAAALALFPAWLPEAAGITGSGGAAVPAARALALRTASATRHFAPFLVDLTERALRQSTGHTGTSRAGTFPAGIRAAGLARVLCSGYRRDEAAILVRMPAGLSSGAEDALVAGCEWLAQHGGFGVWLTGPSLRSVDRVVPMSAPIPEDVAALARELADLAPASGGADPDGTEFDGTGFDGTDDDMDPDGPGHRHGRGSLPVLAYPPLAGSPHPASEAEQRLEAALSSCEWAAGRAWNQPYQWSPLSNPIRVDLLWRAERCVVEIDGPEHLRPLRLAADQRRDLRLRQGGYAVRRFTNRQVLGHIDTVLAELEHFLHARRNGTFEGSLHA